MLINTTSVNLCQNNVFAKLSGCQKWVFRKENCMFCFWLYYVGDRETEKRKKNGKRPKNHIKIVFFKGGHRKWEHEKKDFCKNCLTLFESEREKKTAFRAHYLFWPKKFFGPKQRKPGKTLKIVVSAEIVQNLKWHLFFWKRCFWHGWKLGFTNCVFEKLCSSENTRFIVFSAKNSSCNKKLYVEKNRKFIQNSGLWSNMAKWCFLVCFWGFNGFVVCFLCVWYSCKSVKNAIFFPQFSGLLCGGLFLFIWVWKV